MLLRPPSPCRLSRRRAALEMASALAAHRPPGGAARGRSKRWHSVYDPPQIRVNQAGSSRPHTLGRRVGVRMATRGFGASGDRNPVGGGSPRRSCGPKMAISPSRDIWCARKGLPDAESPPAARQHARLAQRRVRIITRGRPRHSRRHSRRRRRGARRGRDACAGRVQHLWLANGRL